MVRTSVKPPPFEHHNGLPGWYTTGLYPLVWDYYACVC